eukprot:7311977-Prymnesium_polylepis.1
MLCKHGGPRRVCTLWNAQPSAGLPRRTALNMQSVQTSGDPSGQRHSVQRSYYDHFTVQSSQCSLHSVVFTLQR